VRSLVAAGCASLLLLAGCQEQSPPNPPPSSSSVTTSPTPTETATETPTPTFVREAWQLPVKPLTQPVYVDGVAVLLASVEAGLTIVAIDPATGKKLWSRPATTSAVSAQEPLSVAVVGDDIAYFRPTAGGLTSARLVVADVHTGKDLATSPVEVFSTPIQACDQPPTRLCGTARPYLDTAAARYSFIVSTGRYSLGALDQAPVESRPVGPGGLIDLGERSPERVGVFRDGTLLWSMPVVAYFPEGSTTDAGWHFMAYGDRYIGTLEQTFPANGEIDMADIATASFEQATGKIAWSVRGTSLDCHGTLVLPGDVPVRCHYSGHAVFTDGVSRYTDVGVKLEGFVLGTGKRTWEFDLGLAEPFLRGVRVPPLLGEASLLLGHSPVGQRIVDLRTGTESLPAPGTVFLCPHLTSYSSARGEVSGDPLFTPCNSRLALARGTPSVATLASLHQSLPLAQGAMVLVAGPAGVTGYRLTGP
jgi:hypothetical protein